MLSTTEAPRRESPPGNLSDAADGVVDATRRSRDEPYAPSHARVIPPSHFFPPNQTAPWHPHVPLYCHRHFLPPQTSIAAFEEAADVLEAARACLDLSRKPSPPLLKQSPVRPTAELQLSTPITPPRVPSRGFPMWGHPKTYLGPQPMLHVGADLAEPRAKLGQGHIIGADLAKLREIHGHGQGHGAAETQEALARKRKASFPPADGGKPGGHSSKPGRKGRKKNDGAPRRPLSAYNIFFSEERARILEELSDPEDGDTKVKGKEDGASNDSTQLSRQQRDGAPRVLTEATAPISQGTSMAGQPPLELPNIPWAKSTVIPPRKPKRRVHRKTHGKIGFKDLAKTIGQRWKELPAEKLERYQNLAKVEMTRYQADLKSYKATSQQGSRGGVRVAQSA